MRKRLLGIVMMGMILLLTMANPLLAGGWVVVTLDALPREVVAGESTSVGFVIRQHGQTLINLSGPGPLVEAQNTATGERIQAIAQQDGFTGHYRATISFPSSGVWNWQINPQPFTTVALMPPLTVHSGSPPVTVDQPLASSLLLVVQMVQQWWTQMVTTTQPTEQSPSQDDLALYGQDLFLAKGCTACHLHSAAPTAWNTQEGPDLSHYDKTAAFLHLWLADPADVKPTTEMPNLDLNPTEIEALAAFLVQNSAAESY